MQLVVWWKVLVNQAQEKFSYFCGNTFTIWGVKSNDLSFAPLRVVFFSSHISGMLDCGCNLL